MAFAEKASIIHKSAFLGIKFFILYEFLPGDLDRKSLLSGLPFNGSSAKNQHYLLCFSKSKCGHNLTYSKKRGNWGYFIYGENKASLFFYFWLKISLPLWVWSSILWLSLFLVFFICVVVLNFWNRLNFLVWIHFWGHFHHWGCLHF